MNFRHQKLLICLKLIADEINVVILGHMQLNMVSMSVRVIDHVILILTWPQLIRYHFVLKFPEIVIITKVYSDLHKITIIDGLKVAEF